MHAPRSTPVPFTPSLPPGRERAGSLTAVMVLTLAIGLVAGILAQTLVSEANGAAPSVATKPDRDLVTAFYAAANAAIATGDTGGLERLFTVAGSPPAEGAPALDHAGLTRRLACLHAIAPEFRIETTAVDVYGETALARVRLVAGATPDFLGLPLPSSRATAGSLDQFRIVHGQIAGYSSELELPACRPIAAGPLLPSGAREVSPTLELRTYDPGVRGATEVTTRPFALHVRSGELWVDFGDVPGAGAALVHPATAASGPVSETIGPDGSATLGAGDLLLLPAGTRFGVRNRRAEPAVALALTLTPVEPLTYGHGDGFGRGAPARTDYDSQLLAWGGSVLLPEGASLNIGELTLAPGESVPLHVVAGAELVVVEHGAAAVDIIGDPGWIHEAGHAGAGVEHQARLELGAGALVAQGSSAGYRNDGAEPATLLVVTILPLNQARTAP